MTGSVTGEGWRWISGGRFGRSAGDVTPVRSVDEQQNLILSGAVRPAPVRVPISEAHGLRSAEEVVASRPLPGFDQAAIDGYAVRSVDLGGATEETPVVLPVVGEIPAGSRHPLRLQPGQAVHVAAGAPLPTLADTVVPVADTDGGTAKLTVRRSVPSASFVRRVGEDVQPGDIAVRRDAVLGAAQVGMLAAAGRDKVLVHPRPRVCVVSVGDELVDVARTSGAGQVPDVCTHALTAAVREAGGEPGRAGLVRGDARELSAAVQDRLPFSDILVVCGAVGGAAGSEVHAALSELGDLDATRVAMHPGSTQAFGRLGPDGVPTFVFPAHPATALLLFEVMVRPLIRLALGLADPYRRTVSARLTSPVSSMPGRRGYLRARLLRDRAGDYLVQPLGTAGTHLLSSLADCNGLIVLPEQVTEVDHDESVTVAFLPHPRVRAPVAYALPEPSRHPGWPARPGALRTAAGVVALRPVWLRDGAAWSEIRLRDERHLAPWEPTPPGGWAVRHSAAEWPGRWWTLRAAARRGAALPFAITVDGLLAGHVMIGNVVREPLLSAYVGYWCDTRRTGRGVTTAAVALAVDHCFGPVGLHRLEATVRPENAASLRVLAKLGFREEGLFRRYLDVDGEWRDHLCFAITAEEPPTGGLVGRIVAAGRAEPA